LCLAIPFAVAWGETATLVLLHTNDIHDHLRPGNDGIGGMPYVSGYIKNVTAQRKDTLVLDAGDVTEKGDLVANATRSMLTYEALGRAGYQAETLGNHDQHYPLDHLRACLAKMPEVAFVCANYNGPDGQPAFAASKIFQVGPLSVGVIGLTRHADETGEAELQAWAKPLSEEAGRLAPKTQLQVALVHIGSKDCQKLAVLVPEIDVFVSGHTHEALHDAIRVPETGAAIVQAGSYARYVGRLDLTVDLDAKKLVSAKEELVEMNHAAVPCDQAMLDWEREQEKAICPEASHIVGHSNREIGGAEVARLAADAFRTHAHVDAAFCNPGQIIRSSLPKGDVDVNALFLSGGQRGGELVAFETTGKQIADYLVASQRIPKARTEWSGFKAALERDDNQNWKVDSDLKRDGRYRVIMPKMEYDTHYRKAVGKAAPERCDFSFLDAMKSYTESLTQQGMAIDARVEQLK
jgi:2',3'-cyclic-nucleotide 2'-phosphodiesterase (5'-nucleotidase family)